MPPTSIVAESQLDGTFGCLFLAPMLSSILWGAGCLQLYYYYETYWKTDARWLKIYVFVVYILDTIQQALVMAWSYDVFVKGMVDPAQLTRLPMLFKNVAILVAICDVMVEFIFLRRVWYLSNYSWKLTGILSLGVLGQFAATLAYYVQVVQVDNVADLSKLITTEKVINCLTFSTDTAIALVLVVLLQRNRTGLKRTDTVISRLVLYTMGVGSVTSVVSIIALVTIYTAPQTLIYFLIDMVFPKLYFNCMLASLNSRSSLRAISDKAAAGGMSIHLENVPSASATATTSSHSGILRKSSHIECRVDLEVECDSDWGKDLETGLRGRDTVTEISTE